MQLRYIICYSLPCILSIHNLGTDTWRRYAHAPFGIVNQFGLSAPAEKIYEHFGFGLDNLTARASQVCK